jgi:hypothetical protein
MAAQTLKIWSAKEVQGYVDTSLNGIKAGTGITVTKTGTVGSGPIVPTITLNKATSTTLGGIQVGYTTDAANKNYAVQLDTNGNAYVNVNWSDTKYSFYNFKVQVKGTDLITYSPADAENKVNFIEGDNVTLTTNATNKSITIAAKDTTYTLSGSNATVTLTPSSGTATSITVNNVTNATNATNLKDSTTSYTASTLKTALDNKSDTTHTHTLKVAKNSSSTAIGVELSYGNAYDFSIDSKKGATVIMPSVDTSSSTTSTNPVTNALFTSEINTIKNAIAGQTVAYVYKNKSDEKYTAAIAKTGSFKVGDTIYFTDTDIADQWVTAVNSASPYYTFQDLETEHPDLTNYVNTLAGTATNGVITNLTKSGHTLTVTSTNISSTKTVTDGNYISGITQAANGQITSITQKALPDGANQTVSVTDAEGTTTTFDKNAEVEFTAAVNKLDESTSTDLFDLSTSVEGNKITYTLDESKFQNSYSSTLSNIGTNTKNISSLGTRVEALEANQKITVTTSAGTYDTSTGIITLEIA